MAEQVPSYVPKLVKTGQSTATTYHFRCEPRGFGWALATVNDQTGELLIMSDWGHWSHRWSTDPAALGHPTLTHFLADRAGCDYLARKLTTREQRQVFDRAKTVATFRAMLCARRLEVGSRSQRMNRPVILTKEAARELWDDLGEIDTDDATLFTQRFLDLENSHLLDEEPWDSLERVPSSSYVVLEHAILPALIGACIEDLARRAQLENEQAQRDRMEAGHA